MARTNLLKPLTNITGNFYMFSQYAEDLTKENAEKDNYRVVPSKFAALNLDSQALANIASYRGEDDVNTAICRYIQNSYENSCAFFKDLKDVNDNPIWENAYMASRLLWQNLIMYNFIHTEENSPEDPTTIVCPEIKFVGDINIYTNKTLDGICYNEIYCYIPTNAKEGRYFMSNADSSNSGINTPSTYNYNDASGQPMYTLMGWDANNYPANLTTAGILNVPEFGYNDPTDYSTIRHDAYTIHDDNWWYPQALSFSDSEMNDYATLTNVDSDSFDINAMLLFYDVYQGDTCIHRNLPLGMYFTGFHNNIGIVPQRNLSDEPAFTNTITKFINNNDIYGQGTSYGLRVLTKYVCTPTSLYYIDSVVEADDLYPEYYTALDALGEAIGKMDTVIESNRVFHQDIKDHLAYFKNYRTNVPYIRNINGVPFWFVNGKNTGQSAVVDIDAIMNIYDDILNRLNALEQTAVQYG